METNIFIIRRHGNTDAELIELYEKSGYHVFCSRSLIEVLGVIQNVSLNLIISDTEIHLFEGFRKFKKYLNRHQIPIIYLGANKSSDFKFYTDLYIVGILKNPFDSNDIFRLTKKYFEDQSKIELRIPEDIRIFETRTTTIWVDKCKEDVLDCIVKPNPQNLDNTMEFYKMVGKITGNKKVGLLIDFTLIHSSDKNNKDYLMSESRKYFFAVAILSNSVFGRFIARFFIASKKSSVPVKLFTDEKTAQNWIKNENLKRNCG